MFSYYYKEKYFLFHFFFFWWREEGNVLKIYANIFDPSLQETAVSTRGAPHTVPSTHSTVLEYAVEIGTPDAICFLAPPSSPFFRVKGTVCPPPVVEVQSDNSEVFV